VHLPCEQPAFYFLAISFVVDIPLSPRYLPQLSALDSRLSALSSHHFRLPAHQHCNSRCHCTVTASLCHCYRHCHCRYSPSSSSSIFLHPPSLHHLLSPAINNKSHYPRLIDFRPPIPIFHPRDDTRSLVRFTSCSLRLPQLHQPLRHSARPGPLLWLNPPSSGAKRPLPPSAIAHHHK
jgi:hypothetical protein